MKNKTEPPNSGKKKLFQRKKNIPLGMIIKSEKGPMNEPIIFNSIKEGMEYFRTHP